MRAHIVASDLITITAGGNDLIEAGKSFFMNRDTRINVSFEPIPSKLFGDCGPVKGIKKKGGKAAIWSD